MSPYPRRGEVFWARLDKLRPVIILSVDSLNRHALDVCIVPVTTKEHAKFSVRISLKAGDGGLDQDSWAKCDQVTTLEKSLLKFPAMGFLPTNKFASVQEQVKVALGFL